MKPIKQTRTAVIGAGNMGKNHARIYHNISHLIAISDINPDIGKPLAKRYGVNYYRDYHQMFSQEKIEAVSVVVPTIYHSQVAIDCLNLRIPTLVEKPIAHEVVAAESIMASSKENNIYLMVGHVERFNPAIINLKKMIESDKLGTIVSLLSIRVGTIPPKTTQSDVALDLGIHDIDVFNYLLGDYPISNNVERTKLFKRNIADSASITLKYKKAVGMIQTNWITPIKMRKLLVTGTSGFAEVDYIQQKINLYDKILSFTVDGDYLEFLSASDTPKKEVSISKKEPLKQELKYFLKHRLDGFVSPIHAIEALKVVNSL